MRVSGTVAFIAGLCFTLAQAAQGPAQSNPATSAGSKTFAFPFSGVLGQKSFYHSSMVMEMRMSSPVEGQPPVSLNASIDMDLATQVISKSRDGSWTARNRLTNMKMKGVVNGKPLPMNPRSPDFKDRLYTATFDKNGKIRRVSGAGFSENEKQIHQILSQVNPSSFLPPRPVRVGESWPFELEIPVTSLPNAANQTVKTRGEGRLVEVINGQARIDFDLTLEAAGDQLNANGTGKAVTLFDLNKTRITSNKLEMTLDFSPRVVAGAGSQVLNGQIKISMHTSLVK
jgi:hypothetical protein